MILILFPTSSVLISVDEVHEKTCMFCSDIPKSKEDSDGEPGYVLSAF